MYKLHLLTNWMILQQYQKTIEVISNLSLLFSDGSFIQNGVSEVCLYKFITFLITVQVALDFL